MNWTGGCACGAVRYETAGPAFNATLCHCVDCRRASGAPALAWFSVPAAALRWTAGAPVVHRSSGRARRGHCGRCGTQLTWQGDASPDEIDVATATLDDPELAPPRDHTFAAERLSWLRLDDGLPAYPRTRAEGLAPGT
ncbi:GFA family protein [uncultured Massilia sp.]|uniref:GFA family protein n=1 Tax=uncultured Massilia sp. TaxID=169973 RepID=UPI0025EE5EE9|nr:GFA family protein [uncultured Massilia sp.]